jgi:excisionase family DNA binding protein
MEVAERLRVSTATVYAMCKRGTLRHVRAGNSIRVAQADLERLVLGGQSGPPEAVTRKSRQVRL